MADYWVQTFQLLAEEEEEEEEEEEAKTAARINDGSA